MLGRASGTDSLFLGTLLGTTLPITDMGVYRNWEIWAGCGVVEEVYETGRREHASLVVGKINFA